MSRRNICHCIKTRQDNPSSEYRPKNNWSDTKNHFKKVVFFVLSSDRTDSYDLDRMIPKIKIKKITLSQGVPEEQKYRALFSLYDALLCVKENKKHPKESEETKIHKRSNLIKK